jgi:hypothetical protein
MKHNTEKINAQRSVVDTLKNFKRKNKRYNASCTCSNDNCFANFSGCNSKYAIWRKWHNKPSTKCEREYRNSSE